MKYLSQIDEADLIRSHAVWNSSQLLACSSREFSSECKSSFCFGLNGIVLSAIMHRILRLWISRDERNVSWGTNKWCSHSKIEAVTMISIYDPYASCCRIRRRKCVQDAVGCEGENQEQTCPFLPKSNAKGRERKMSSCISASTCRHPRKSHRLKAARGETGRGKLTVCLFNLTFSLE